jgi:hypothetical protein
MTWTNRRTKPAQRDLSWGPEPFALVSQSGINFERVRAETARAARERAAAEGEQERFDVFDGGEL